MRPIQVKRMELFYCLSGVFFAAALFLTILSLRYGNTITTESRTLRGIGFKSEAMKKSVKDMEALVGTLNLRGEAMGMRPQAAILASLDKIKTRLKASSISVAAFNESGGAVRLGVEIEAPLTDYAAFVREIHYLESMSLPWFRTESIVIAGENDGYIVRVKGEAMMPVEDGSGE